jgi:glucan phosphoethanolaminetransferase (alkaline phosphatase superfamily)
LWEAARFLLYHVVAQNANRWYNYGEYASLSILTHLPKEKNMLTKLYRLSVAVFAGFFALLLALAVPIFNQVVLTPVSRLAAVADPLLIAYTFAQTAPETIAEMSTEVTGFANTLMPSWLIYVVFALIAALGIWLIQRAISGMKRG